MKKFLLLFCLMFGMGIMSVSAQSSDNAAVDVFCNVWTSAAAKAKAATTAAEAQSCIENVESTLTDEQSLIVMAGFSDPLSEADKTRIKSALFDCIYVIAEKEMLASPGELSANELELAKQMLPGAIKMVVDPIVDKSNTLEEVINNMAAINM